MRRGQPAMRRRAGRAASGQLVIVLPAAAVVVLLFLLLTTVVGVGRVDACRGEHQDAGRGECDADPGQQGTQTG